MPKLVNPHGKKTFVHNFKKVRLLGEGFEGKVYLMSGTVRSRKGRVKTIALAEKRFSFTFDRPSSQAPNRWSPVKQFELAKELVKINREQNAGLRLPPTIRLGRRFFSKTIITTPLNVIEKEKLTPEQKAIFESDEANQQRILKNLGYGSYFDAFLPVLTKTGKIQAFLVDFGTVYKLPRK